MSDKKRTIDTVRFEIESLERTRDSALSAARALHLKTDLEARVKATGAVGKIERTYAIPACEEARKTRDASHTRAKDIRDAAIAAAHGAFETSKREADKMYEVARDSIDEKTRVEKQPHEETLRNTQADALSAYEAEVALAHKEFEKKSAPLAKEIEKLRAELKTVQSEIPLVDPEAKPKKGKKAKGVEAGA